MRNKTKLLQCNELVNKVFDWVNIYIDGTSYQSRVGADLTEEIRKILIKNKFLGENVSSISIYVSRHYSNEYEGGFSMSITEHSPRTQRSSFIFDKQFIEEWKNKKGE